MVWSPIHGFDFLLHRKGQQEKLRDSGELLGGFWPTLSDFASYIRKFAISGEIPHGWQMPQFAFPLRPCSFTTSCLSLGESDIIW